MSAPLPLFQQRDAAVCQTFYDAATAAAVSSASGQPSTAPPPPLPPPPPGQLGRQQQSPGGNSSRGRTNSSHKINGNAQRDKGTPSSTINAAGAEKNTDCPADATVDTAALLQLHLQLNQHLQRGQQLVSDADIIRALKRLALNSTRNGGTREPPPPPPCGERGTEQQFLRGKSSVSSYASLQNGYQEHRYGRAANERSTLSVREGHSGTNASRGSLVGSGTISTNQGGQQPASTTGSNALALRERAPLVGTKNDEVGCSADLFSSNRPHPPTLSGSQQNRSGQHSATGRSASRGKQQQDAQSWRCRTCDTLNVGHLAGRCSCCNKLQQPVHISGNNMLTQQHGAGRHSLHSHKHVQQQGATQQQQQNLQLQQLHRDVLLAAVSAAAAAAEKRADDKKVKRVAAAAAAIAAESQLQQGSNRQRASQAQCAPCVAPGSSESLLNSSQEAEKDFFEDVSGLCNSSGGPLASEKDSSFESLKENFLRQQHHGHMVSGRLLTEEGYEDAAAAAAATLFPGLLQNLENRSSASTHQPKGLAQSLHDVASGRGQQPQLTRAGSGSTSGAASTSHSTPLGLSSDMLEGSSPLEREGIGCGRLANCPSSSSSLTDASALLYNAGSSISRGSAASGNVSNAGDGLGLDCGVGDSALGSINRLETSQSFPEGLLGDVYGAAATNTCFGGSNTRTRLLGGCGSYQGSDENVLSSAPGLPAGKSLSSVPGCAGGECGATPFSAATLLPEADILFDGSGSTTGMNIMAFQEFGSGPQSTLYGDVITPGAESLNLLGDCRSLSSATPSSLLSRSESNSIFNSRAHVGRIISSHRRSALGHIDTACPEGADRSSRVDRTKSKNLVGAADTLLATGSDDNRDANHRDLSSEIRGAGQHSGAGRNAVGRYPLGDRSDQKSTQVRTIAVGRASSATRNQGNAYAHVVSQHGQQANAATAAAVVATAIDQPFCQNSLQQQLLLQGARVSDSPQCGGGSDFSLTRSSLPFSSASSPSAGMGGIEELSPLAFNGGNIGGPQGITAEGASAAGQPMDPANLEALLPTFLSPVQILLLEAKEVADRLVEEFTTLGYADPTSKAAEALRTSLAILGYASTSTTNSQDEELKTLLGEGSGCTRVSNGVKLKSGGAASTGARKNSTTDCDGASGGLRDDMCRKSKNANWVQGVGGPHFSAPAMLAHPDEFKNPSSFLKIYGDPMCAVAEANSCSPQAGLYGSGGRGAPRSGSGGASGRCGEGSGGGSNLPIKGHNGNWVCDSCSNVNFPRRFRCNKCGAMRGAQGDAIVAEYAKLVYHQHLKTYRNLASRPGVDLPLKRLQGPAGGGSAGGAAGGGSAGHAGGKKSSSSSSYCSPSSNGGSTTTNSITGSTPSTPSDTANMAALQSMATSTGSLQGTSTYTANSGSIADGTHPSGPDGCRGAKGSRMPVATHSNVGGGNPGTHRSQNLKGQNTSGTQSLVFSTRSEANGSAGSLVNCGFQHPACTLGSATSATEAPRFQPESAAYDENVALRGVSHHVGSSPRVSRVSATKSNRVGRASLNGNCPDNSPQACRGVGNCNAGPVERQKGFSAAPASRPPRPNQAHFLHDNKMRPDAVVYGANCSATGSRQSASNGDNDGERSPTVCKEDGGFAKEKSTCNKQNNEADQGGMSTQAPAVAHTPSSRRVSSTETTRGSLSALAIGNSTEGTDCNAKSSGAVDTTKEETRAQVKKMETRPTVVCSEGPTTSHVV